MANLLDLSPDEFMFTLNEFGYSPERRDELIRQYRDHNSVFGSLNRAAQERQAEIASEGRRPVAGGFLSKPEGALGMDAVRGLRVEPMAGLLGMLTGAGRAVDAPVAAARGLIPVDDIPLEALGTAGVASLGGAAMARPAGSVGMGGRVAGDIDARVAAARQAVLDNPNDAALFDQYKALRRERDALGARPSDVPAERAPTASEGFEAYLSRVNPAGARIAETERPNLGMGDMYGMLPRNARKVGERDGVEFYRGPDGATYATAFNPDVGEMDVVGYSMPSGNMTDLAVVSEMQGRGIGSELQYLMRSQDPYALSGGLTEAGERTLRGTYDRLRDEGIVAANRDQTVGLLSTAAAAEPRNAAERMARDILDMRAAGRAGEVTDEMMAQADPQYMFANTPLPMDEASRMARAGEMGFDETSFYHGTGADFAAFSDEALGRNTKAFSSQFGHFLTSDPRVASRFGSDGVALPLVTQGGRYVDGGALAVRHDRPRINRLGEPVEDQDGNPVYSWEIDPHDAVFDMLKDGPASADPRAYVSARKAAGVRGLDLLGTLYDGVQSNWHGYQEPHNVRVVFDPANVRSRFARFDPEFAHLANLNAANIDPLAGLFGALAAEEQRRQRSSR